MMERRTFISGISLALLAPPLVAEAQSEARIAFLCVDSCSTLPNAVLAWDRAFLNGLEQAGYALGVEIYPVEAATARDLEKAFALIARGRADGLLLLEHLMGPLGSGEISQFALQRRLPTVDSCRPAA